MPAETLTATPISQAFTRAKAEGRTAFMPFLTAGDPDIAATIRLVQRLATEKVDLIEIGFPYSDPIARSTRFSMRSGHSIRRACPR
jgi:tryptophan synthase alpha chain